MWETKLVFFRGGEAARMVREPYGRFPAIGLASYLEYAEMVLHMDAHRVGGWGLACLVLLGACGFSSNVAHAQWHQAEAHSSRHAGTVAQASYRQGTLTTQRILLPNFETDTPGTERWEPQRIFQVSGSEEMLPPPSAPPEHAQEMPQQGQDLPFAGGYSRPEPRALTPQGSPYAYDTYEPLDDSLLRQHSGPGQQEWISPHGESHESWGYGGHGGYDGPGAYCSDDCYTWTLLPREVLWKSYVGGPREARMAQSFVNLRGGGWLWELQAGGRAGIVRYGTDCEGWQLDLWGSAFPRLNFDRNLDLEAADFKVGVPLTYTSGPFQMKLEWYHLSSHLGDEFLLRPENAGVERINYLRDSIVFALGWFVTPEIRLYGEVDYAYKNDGGSKPWHFQTGIDYSPCGVTPLMRPLPFFAVNAHFREEVNYSGGLNVVAGMQWRGPESSAVFRTGIHYYTGQSLQYSFLGQSEEFLGLGMWYDF